MIGLGVKPNCVRRYRAISRAVCSLLILGICFPGDSFAQDIAGRLIGRVQDSSGAVVVGAKVTAHNDDTGIDTYSDERFFSYRRSVHRGEPDYGRHVHAIALASE